MRRRAFARTSRPGVGWAPLDRGSEESMTTSLARRAAAAVLAVAMPLAFTTNSLASTRSSTPASPLPNRPIRVLAPDSQEFNSDAFEDLAAGVPGEDVNGAVDAGAVNVLYGTASGLASSGNQFWTQGGGGLLDSAEEGDEFGS